MSPKSIEAHNVGKQYHGLEKVYRFDKRKTMIKQKIKKKTMIRHRQLKDIINQIIINHI